MAVEIALDRFLSHYQIPRPADWVRIFGRPSPVHLEIGSGHGDFLLRQAQENPGVNFIGIEQEWERVKKTLRKIELSAAGGGGGSFPNVYILQMDATVALERLFRQESLQKIYCLFPCPWPKKRHIKYRLFAPDFLRLLNSRLEPNGEVHIVTDAAEYFSWVLDQLDGTGFRHEKRVIAAQYGTKFERKWSAQGQREFFELRLLKREHQSYPVQEDVPLRVYLTNDFLPEKFHFIDQQGAVSILLKEFIHDPKKAKAMVRFVVSEKNMTQQLWITIGKRRHGWHVAKAEGCPIIPSSGIAQAIHLTAEAVARTTGGEFWAADEQSSSDESS